MVLTTVDGAETDGAMGTVFSGCGVWSTVDVVFGQQWTWWLVNSGRGVWSTVDVVFGQRWTWRLVNSVLYGHRHDELVASKLSPNLQGENRNDAVTYNQTIT